MSTRCSLFITVLTVALAEKEKLARRSVLSSPVPVRRGGKTSHSGGAKVKTAARPNEAALLALLEEPVAGAPSEIRW